MSMVGKGNKKENSKDKKTKSPRSIFSSDPKARTRDRGKREEIVLTSDEVDFFFG